MENNFNSRVTDEEKIGTYTTEQHYQILSNKEHGIEFLIKRDQQTPPTTMITTTHAKSKNERKKKFKERCEELKRQKTIADNRNLQSSFEKGKYKQILKERNLFPSILVKDLEELTTLECTEKQIQKTLEQVAEFLT